MGKKRDQSSKKAPNVPRADAQQLSAATKAVDPALAALFDSSVCMSEEYSILYEFLRLV